MDKKEQPEEKKKKRVILKKGLLLKTGKTGLSSKKTLVEIAVGPSAFCYYEKEGAKVRKETPISCEGTMSTKPQTKTGWPFIYTIPEGRQWLFMADTEEEQLQWSGAFQIAIIACTPRTAKSKEMYGDVYLVLDTLREAKKATESRDRPYLGDGETFMTDELVAVAGQKLMDVSSALTDLQERRKDPWFSEVFKYYNNFVPAIRAAIDLMSRRLTAHTAIKKYSVLLKEAHLLLQQGKTRAAERKWAEITALHDDLSQGGADGIYRYAYGKEKGQLIPDIKPFDEQVEKDSVYFQKLLDQCLKRDAVISNELRSDPYLRAVEAADRALAANLRPYKHGSGFLVESHVRSAETSLNRANRAFDIYAQEIKEIGDDSVDTRNFIGESRNKLSVCQATFQALQRRTQLHILFRDFVELSEPVEGLIFSGQWQIAQEEWAKCQEIATKALNWPEENPELSPVKGVTAKGVVAEEDREAFASWYRERVLHISKLFKDAESHQKQMDLASGTGMGTMDNAFHWLNTALAVNTRKWTIKLIPLQQWKQGHPKSSQLIIWQTEKGIQSEDVDRATSCADATQRVLSAVAQHYSFPGFNEIRKKWETTLRGARETIQNMIIRVNAQKAIEEFLELSLPIEYFIAGGHLDDARNAWVKADALAQSILDRADFRLPNDSQKYIADVQQFTAIYTSRSTQAKNGLQAAAAAKLYVKKVPLFSALHGGDEDEAPAVWDRKTPSKTVSSPSSSSSSSSSAKGGLPSSPSFAASKPAQVEGAPDQLYPLRSEGAQDSKRLAKSNDEDEPIDLGDEEGDGEGVASPAPAPAPAAAAPAAAASAKKKSNPFGDAEGAPAAAPAKKSNPFA